MRNLATIQLIEDLKEIPGADSILVASVLGWRVVVRKGEFAIGDQCVYVEIDSVLPQKEEFEFLKERKYRVRTIRLRGQVSQGICFPMSILNGKKYKDFNVGDDVSEVLGIVKYESPENISSSRQRDKFVYPNWMPVFIRKFLTKQVPWLGKFIIRISPRWAKTTEGKTWPPYFPKTDETRVQVLGKYLEKYAGTPCFVTEKLDGSSMSVFNVNGRFGVCSRNMELKSKDNNWWKVVHKYHIDVLLPPNIALQGELVGPGIQGNKYQLADHDVYFFNGYDISNRRYLNYEELAKMLAYLELPQVPVLDPLELKPDVDYFVNLSIGRSKLNNSVQREGIVIRPIDDIYDDVYTGKFQGNRISFKAVSPEFLLKYGE